MKNIYITTAIPYVNNAPHVGFALELIQADVIARYNRLSGKNVFFQTGTDDNALKNALSAEEKSIPTREFVNFNAALFRELCDRLNISYDNFIRTAGELHKKGVEKFWRDFSVGDVFVCNYQGLYCVGCEDFCLEGNLINGCCPEHHTKPEIVNEKNFFFRLSAYQDKLYELISSDTIRIIPQKLKPEVLNFITQGLKDISISRTAEKSRGWGIPVPDHPEQVIYVWIDALINYVSGLGYGKGVSSKLEFWDETTEKIHVIGKNVWKFHAVYWPALLLSAGIVLPNKIVIHGFLTANGEKISKSLSNSVNPIPLIDFYGADALRYYLLRYFSPFSDGDFSGDELKSVYNSDLSNGIGNLVSRLLKLCELCDYTEFQASGIVQISREYFRALENFEYNNALKSLWNEIAEINVSIDKTQPWLAVKNGNKSVVREHLGQWLNKLYAIAYYLSPFLPLASRKIIELLYANPIKFAPPVFPRL